MQFWQSWGDVRQLACKPGAGSDCCIVQGLPVDICNMPSYPHADRKFRLISNTLRK